jgi:hypothetical protein
LAWRRATYGFFFGWQSFSFSRKLSRTGFRPEDKCRASALKNDEGELFNIKVVVVKRIYRYAKSVTDLRTEGWNVSEENLTFLSPYFARSVKRFGEYVFAFDRELGPSRMAGYSNALN